MNKIITGVVAGIIVFAWGMVSWMVLPLHKDSIEKLNVPIALEAVKQAAPESGMYAYPHMDASKEEMKNKPHVLVVTNYAEKSLPVCMGIGFLIQLLGGIFLACLVSKSGLEKFGDRMKLILKVVIFTGIVGSLPNWHYWGFTPMYTALEFADLIIGWGLAGLWIAKRA